MAALPGVQGPGTVLPPPAQEEEGALLQLLDRPRTDQQRREDTTSGKAADSVRHATAGVRPSLSCVRLAGNWTDLASRPSRVAARLVDIALMVVAAAAGFTVARAIGASALISALAVVVPLALLYEPVTALTGGTPGKRMMRIEAVSVWDNRSLGRPDALRRALTASAQLLWPPLILRNLAWLLWDPARQCLHDRAADSIVVRGRSRTGSGR